MYDPSQQQYTDADIESVLNQELQDIPEHGMEYSDNEESDFYADGPDFITQRFHAESDET